MTKRWEEQWRIQKGSEVRDTVMFCFLATVHLRDENGLAAANIRLKASMQLFLSGISPIIKGGRRGGANGAMAPPLMIKGGGQHIFCPPPFAWLPYGLVNRKWKKNKDFDTFMA